MKRRKFLSNLILGCFGLPLFGITKKQTDHDEFLQMARHAKQLGIAQGIDPIEAINSMTSPYSKRNLDLVFGNLGIIADTKGAYEKYVKTLDVSEPEPLSGKITSDFNI